MMMSNEERSYLQQFYADERRPLIIRELDSNGQIINEDLDYSHELGVKPAFSRALVTADGGIVWIDMDYNDPQRYQPPPVFNSHEARDLWFARYRPKEADDEPFAYLENVSLFPTRQFWHCEISLEDWQVLYDRWKEYHPDAP